MSAARLVLCVGCVLALLACGRRQRLEACNIAKPECQKDIYYAVMRLRGDGWDPFDGLPPIHTLTLAAYRNSLEAQAEPSAPDTPVEKPKVNPWDVTLQLLGLVTPSVSSGQASIDSRVSNVAAFYSSATGKVTVIDRGTEHDDSADTSLLAHELVHAFQDNEVSGDIGGSSTDGSFTAKAQIEGEAVLYQRLIGAEIDDVEPQQLDWSGYYRDWRDGMRKNMPGQTSPFYSVGWYVYPFGGGLMTKTWLEGGNGAVRDLGTTFPRRSVDLMAVSDGKTAGTTKSIACNLLPPADGFAAAGFDRFGAMQLYAFLTAAAVDEQSAWDQAERWRDDLIWIYFNQDSELVAFTWRVRLADRGSADLVVEAAATREGLHAERQGNDAVIVGSNNAELLASWPGARDCQP